MFVASNIIVIIILKYQPLLKSLDISDDSQFGVFLCTEQSCRYYNPDAQISNGFIVRRCSNKRMLVDDDCPIKESCMSYESIGDTPYRGELSSLRLAGRINPDRMDLGGRKIDFGKA